MKYESLHNHTTISDGIQSHLEVLDTAEKNGFGTIAFTDHDIMPSERELETLRSYTGPVKWVIGTEISSGLPHELGGGSTNGFHILGLFIDPFNEGLLEHSKLALAARKDRMEKIVSNLTGLGFVITADDCLEASGGESVGRPHIVEALLKRKENVELMQKLRDDMEVAAKTDKEVAKNFEQVLDSEKRKGIAGTPYAVFLSDTAYIKDVYVDYTYVADMDKSVELIRNAGGLAVVAHYWTIENKINRELLKQFLVEGRIDGAEIASASSSDDITDFLVATLKETDSIQTIGADAHKPEDFEYFASLKGLAEKTEGMTKKLIKEHDLQLEWSNIS